jgi:hypothetical protein
MTARTKKTDPYCSFQDDRRRLLALISRDIRYALVAACLALGGSGVPWAAVIKWIGLAA